MVTGTTEETVRCLELPREVEQVFRHFRTCEFSTLARDGTLVTWPVVSMFQPHEGRFLITTSIGLPQKALNVRRNPRVALLFSDPTGSGLTAPPAVLVQGGGQAPETIVTSTSGHEGLKELMRLTFQRQRRGVARRQGLLLRRLFDWYYMRVPIHVMPRRIWVWDGGNFARRPREIEVRHVG